MKIFPRGNWGLKILALILAIVIYFAMKDALRDTSFRNTPSFMKGNLTNDAAR
jgi:hypothetical protein